MNVTPDPLTTNTPFDVPLIFDTCCTATLPLLFPAMVNAVVDERVALSVSDVWMPGRSATLEYELPRFSYAYLIDTHGSSFHPHAATFTPLLETYRTPSVTGSKRR